MMKHHCLKFTNLVTIQAGANGLKGVFLEELIASAIQDFGADQVRIHSINRNKSFLMQSMSYLKTQNPKYLILDPRTLSSNGIVGVFQSFFSSLMFSARNITPIVFLTDASIIKLRLESVIWTSKNGKCIMLYDPVILGKLLPHKRVYGPIFMPISLKTINTVIESNCVSKNSSTHIGFIGTIYPERAEYLEELIRCSKKLNIHVNIQEKKTSFKNKDYWEFLNSYEIIFTTTVQTNIEKNKVDNLEINQMVFRISEAIALGKILITTPVNGLDKFFKRDYDFIEMGTLNSYSEEFESAVKKAKILIGERKPKDNASYIKLITNRCFWKILGIDDVNTCDKLKCACFDSIA